MEYHFSEEHFSNPSLTVSYAEFVNAKDTFMFEMEGSSYSMYDSYCKNLDCECTNAHIYVPELGARGKFFTFDYEKKEFVEPNVPNELKEKLEDEEVLHELFAQRHRFIKKAFTIAQNEREIKTLNNTMKHLGLGGKKMGRNEPCFCGSGKKYKNCCGK